MQFVLLLALLHGLPPGADPPAATRVVEPADGAAIKGVARFAGVRPRHSQLRAPPAGAPCAPDAAQRTLWQAHLVFFDGTLPYVFVYVKSGLKKTYPPPTEPAVIEQRGCVYSPHVFGMMAGQPLKVVNADRVMHNLVASPKKNHALNVIQTTTDPKILSGSDTFTRPEVMIEVTSGLRKWMRAYIGVVDHPFFAVTSAGGTFEIKGLPPGEYELEAWHEKWGSV